MPSRRKTVAVAAGLLAAVDAFQYPGPMVRLRGPSAAIRMATQPPPDAKLELPKVRRPPRPALLGMCAVQLTGPDLRTRAVP